MTAENGYMGQLVFGLDIGTRSIVGTVGYKDKDQFIVVAQRVKEHETRAMLDGQIHDIGKVGESIRVVKEELEAAIGRKLTDVCIAAAGRVLKTVTTHTEVTFDSDKEVKSEDIYALTASGVEQAYSEFLKDIAEEGTQFYCVGHSVIRYYLNGYQMGNLEGHKAHKIGEDLIATFLPEDVVDGLYKAVELAGLTVANMTLEPIAAIQVAIPERFRMLNIALIDVGAGTSDISITDDGCITAYGMIPMAGDALTEEIAKHLLVDFQTAEMVKREAGEKELIEFQDIMFLPQTVTRETVYQITQPVVDTMATQAADKIRELNGGKPVSAVFVVGGGGKIHGYTEKVAQELGIVKERVALRGEEVMQQIRFEEDIQKDSLLVTPVGICLNFYEQSNNFIFVNFNENKVKIYDNNRLTVGDAAMQAGFPNDGLFPRRGQALNFTLNGESRMIRGESGDVAQIYLNGAPADISTPIHANDLIQVVPSTAGTPAKAQLSDLKEFHKPIVFTVNENKLQLPRLAKAHGEVKTAEYEIKEADQIEILNYYTVEELSRIMDMDSSQIDYVLINGARADLNTYAYENSTIVYVLKGQESVLDGDDRMTGDPSGLSEQISGDDSNVQQEETTSRTEIHSIFVIANKKSIELKGKASYVYVDVFDEMDFDLTKPRGKGIVTNLNGRPAQYMEELHDGDVIDIYWIEG